jgi:catechol 2,3-dioxygenase-like lactoylglutathione lyase family enzyme
MTERAVAVIPADDLAVAREFYIARLGFQEIFASTRDGHEGLIGLRRGDLYLTIDAPMSGHGRKACVAFHVDDADDYYSQWSNKVDTAPPKNEPWGGRTFGFQDPSDNTIFIIGPVTAG